MHASTILKCGYQPAVVCIRTRTYQTGIVRTLWLVALYMNRRGAPYGSPGRRIAVSELAEFLQHYLGRVRHKRCFRVQEYRAVSKDSIHLSVCCMLNVSGSPANPPPTTTVPSVARSTIPPYHNDYHASCHLVLVLSTLGFVRAVLTKLAGIHSMCTARRNRGTNSSTRRGRSSGRVGQSIWAQRGAGEDVSASCGRGPRKVTCYGSILWVVRSS